MMTDKPKDNMELWDRVFASDPKHTKSFTRPGGFKGTSVDILWNIQRATEMWGPLGSIWFVEEIDRVITHDAWFSRIQLTYPLDNNKNGIVTQWGGTALVLHTGKVDDDAAKKSFSDGLSKCLSWLGFSADIHLWLHDDN